MLIEQIGFRPERSCMDQVFSLTTYSAEGFQRKLKTSTAFINLSHAKLFRIIPCQLAALLINNMLNNWVIITTNTTSSRNLKNRITHGSVFTPLFLSLHIADIPDITYKNSDSDWDLTTRCNLIEAFKEMHNRSPLYQYMNQLSNSKLNIKFEGTTLLTMKHQNTSA